MNTARTRLIVLPILLLLPFAEALGATLAAYTFTGSTLGPTSSPSGVLTASAVTFGSGSSRYTAADLTELLAVNTSTINIASGTAASSALATAAANSAYFEFTITPAAGRTLYLTSLTLDTAYGVTAGSGVRSSIDGYTSNLHAAWITAKYPAWTVVTVDLSGAAFQGLTSAVTFRIYTWTSYSSSQGVAAYDNITLNGTTNTLSQTITGFTASPSSGTVGGTSTLSVTGSGGSGNAVTYGSSTTGICTVSGTTVSYLAVGTCTVTGNQAGNDFYYAATPVSLNIAVGKGSQTITGFAASPSSGTVGGTSTLSVTGSGASGNAVTYGSSTTGVCTVSGSTVSYVAAGTCTVTADQAGNANYNAAVQVSANVTVGKASQTITGFAVSPSSGTVGGSSTLSVTGRGASGNPVTYATTTGICTVSSSTVSYVAAGTCTVTADQAGNANYNAAAQVSANVTVGKASQTITGFAASPSSGTVGGSSILSMTGSGASGNAVTYGSTATGICTVSGSTVSYVAAGTCTVTADQAGNVNYDAAAQVSLNIPVGKGSQTITGFAASPATGTVGGGGSTLSVTGSGASGNPVTYASTTTDICTVSDGTVSYVAAGTCTVTADQAGNANYDAAAQVSLNITVGKKSQTITGFAASPATGTVGGGTSTLSVTGSGASGNPVTYASTTTDICTVSDGIVSYVAAGTCTVTVNQAGNDNYSAAGEVSLDITVRKADPVPALTETGWFALLAALGLLGAWQSRRRPATGE